MGKERVTKGVLVEDEIGFVIGVGIGVAVGVAIACGSRITVIRSNLSE